MADEAAEAVVAEAPAKAAPAPKAEAKAVPAKAEAATGESDTPSDSGYDWRGKLAGEDKKFRKELDRYTDEPSFAKAYQEARARATDPRRVMIPGEEATDEERAAWAKSRGIPESPDKYEIRVKPPEGMELSDAEKERLTAITAKLHKAGGVKADPEVVNLAHQIFYEERAEAESQMEAAAILQKEKSESFLKKLWQGPELKRNVSFADQAIQHFFGKDFAEIKDMQFADGTRLGDHPEFVQAMAKVGRITMEDPVFLEAGRNGADPVDSLQKQKDQIMGLMSSNPRAYAEAAREGGRLDQINDALERHSQRQASH